MAREITTVAVVGLGTMGAGIAEVMARGGLDVVAVETDEARVAGGRGHVERSTSRAVARGRLSETEQQALIGRIRFTSTLEDVAAAQLVVEAVPDKLDLLFPYLNDAVRMLSEHYAGVDDIDTAMKAGCGYPVGPFELLDSVGLDAALAVQSSIYAESREPGHAPVPLLEQLVRAGRGFRTSS